MGTSRLRELPARAIVTAIADAAARWSDADFPPRVRVTAAIEARTGYTTPVVDYALDRLFFSLRADALIATITNELGSLEALDGFTRAPFRPDGWARGADHVVFVASDTTIGVALVPAVFALCAKCAVTVKDRSDALVAAFFETLVEERAEFRDAAIARPWTGGNDPGEHALLARADVVVAFGADRALRAIRERVAPESRFIGYGHRASIGYLDLARTTVDDDVCERIARDATLYDADGCLSLHALFVAGGDADARSGFAGRLARACERIAVDFPAGNPGADRAARAASHTNLAAFRAAGGRGAVYRQTGATTLVIEPPITDPPPLLPRILPVHPVRTLEDVVAYVRAQHLPVQAIGVAETTDPSNGELADAIGAVRVTPFGTMQDPPLGGRHGGRSRIAEFVRWIDRE